MAAGLDRGQFAEDRLADVAGEALQRGRVLGADGEAHRAAVAAHPPGGPELAVAGEADRRRPLAVLSRRSAAGAGRARSTSGRRGRSTAGRAAIRRPAGAASARRSRRSPASSRGSSGPCRRRRRRGRARLGPRLPKRMRISGAAQSACAAGSVPSSRTWRFCGAGASPLPEHVGGGGGDPPEVRRRLAVPGGAPGDHVGEAVERCAREGVEVDRAVGVAGVERLLRVGGDLGVGELDQRHMRVGARSARRRRSGPGRRRAPARRGRSGRKARSSAPWPGGPTGASRSTRKLE